VKAGLVKPNPTHCLCSLGMMENLFSKVANNTVNVEVEISDQKRNRLYSFRNLFGILQ
jgi:hypothetical protein